MNADFLKALHSLCIQHGIANYAIVARDHESVPWMYARAYTPRTDPLTQRDEAAKIHFDLSGLAAQVLAETWAPRDEEVEPADHLTITTGDK